MLLEAWMLEGWQRARAMHAFAVYDFASLNYDTVKGTYTISPHYDVSATAI